MAAKDTDGGISAETSNRVCAHINDDHAVSVYAMAKAMLGSGYGKITDATLKEVSLDGCNIAVVTCKGELCEMKRLIYPFQPRLKSGSEIRPRMVTIHGEVCAPQVSWLVTHLDALAVFIVVALLGYGTHIVTIDQLATSIENSTQLNSAISMLFGSASFFSKLVKYAWFFALVVHAGEGFYVAYHAQYTLKLGLKTRLLWFLLVCSVGFPITKEFLELLTFHSKKPKDSKKGH